MAEVESPARSAESRAGSAAALMETAVRHHVAGQRDDAIRAYRRVLALESDHAAASNNLGALVAASGQLAEAESLFRRAVTADPNYGEAHNNLGILLAERGEFEEAIPWFLRAIELDPGKPAWLNNYGNALAGCFRLREANDAFDRLLALAPGKADYWNNRALVLRGLRRAGDAEASLRKALELDPEHLNATVNLGVLLKEERQYDEAIRLLERAAGIASQQAPVWTNLAGVYERLGDFERARTIARRALASDPAYAEAYNVLANCAMEEGQYDTAEQLYDSTLRHDPRNANANWNLALIWLIRGDFERGWRQFEWRKRLHSVVFDHDDYGPNAWDGSPLNGRTILLHAEQGIGDVIQFVRYAKVLASSGAGQVFVECPFPLVPLLRGVEGVAQVVARGTELPRYDVHANLMSIPGLLGTRVTTIPSHVPYIPVEPRSVQSTISNTGSAVKVGLVWAGNPAHARDTLRSLPLSALGPILNNRDVTFFSLQKGEGPEAELAASGITNIVNLAPQLNDMRDTAAAIDALDLVITVDTGVAHLAGAVGKETWLLLPHVPDFRWMLDRDDSPWYPTMRLFRQPAPRQWQPVVERVAEELNSRPSRLERSAMQGADAVVALDSVTRTPDGRPRFDLWVPLAGLNNPYCFAQYEAELVGTGAEIELRTFLQDNLRATDHYIDVDPGLGLATLEAATTATAPEWITVVDRNAANGQRVVDLARRYVPTAQVNCRRSLADALETSTAQRVVVRLPAHQVEQLVAMTGADSPNVPALLIIPGVAPEQTEVFRHLQSAGYRVCALSALRASSQLNPLDEVTVVTDLVALAPGEWSRLGQSNAFASVDAPVQAIAFDWEVRTDTGWGVYGFNLSLELARRGLSPVVLRRGPIDASPLLLRQFDAALQNGLSSAASVDVLLSALGNNAASAPSQVGLTARRRAGIIFFEDTHFDAEALEQLNRFDVVVAGSQWNADVLSERGVERVAMVHQGVDPTIFHPAPSSGLFTDRFVIFSGGKLEFRKGQDIVVAAFREFHRAHPDALLITAWHNNWPQTIRDLEAAGHVTGTPGVHAGRLDIASWLERNGVDPASVIDIGPTPNALMGQIFREAHCALFPNRCEGGTNLVAMECIASGIPTIVSQNTGHCDLLSKRACVPLVDQRAVPQPRHFFRQTEGWGESQIDEILSILERLYTDRASARAIGEKGASALAAMTWQQQVSQLLDTVARRTL